MEDLWNKYFFLREISKFLGHPVRLNYSNANVFNKEIYELCYLMA